jgi:hypothetical protein
MGRSRQELFYDCQSLERLVFRPIDLELNQVSIADGIRRTLDVSGSQMPGREQCQIVFDLVGETDVRAPETMDAAVLSVIFHAMQQHQPLRVRGSLSRQFLRNMTEFQQAWSLFASQRYQPVDIRADRIVDVAPRPIQRSLAAFSGGVDSSFTLVRHCLNWIPAATYPVAGIMIVHGFDIPLSRPDGFSRLLARVKPLLDEFDVARHVVRTNLRDFELQSWEHSHAAALAACLNQFTHLYDAALVGSTDPYNNLTIPWGSSPVTDHLLSTSMMPLVHDGAGFSRTAKVAAFSKIPLVLKTLAVCWEGAIPGRNCGVCQKCIRTRLNFLAAEISDHHCFDAVFDLSLIISLPIATDLEYQELSGIVDYAEQHGKTGEWRSLLHRRLRKWRLV